MMSVLGDFTPGCESCNITWHERHLYFLCGIRLLFLNTIIPTDSPTTPLQSFGEAGLQGEAWKKAAWLVSLNPCRLRRWLTWLWWRVKGLGR